MKGIPLRCLTVIVGLTTSIITLVSVGFAQDAPFVYYYSRDDQAFVIAQADGENPEIFIPFSLQENYLGEMGIYGDGWSPSGELFAWIMRRSEGGPRMAHDLYVYGADGNEVDTLSFEAQTRQGIFDFRWSPTQDIVAVALYDYTDVFTSSIAIYDPRTRAFSDELMSDTQIGRGIESLQWSQDGRYVVVVYEDFVQIIEIETEEITLFENLSLSSTQTLDVREGFNGEPNLVVLSSEVVPQEMIVSNGVLFNLVTREIIDLHPVQSVNIPVYNADVVRWHPEGRYSFMASMYNAMFYIKVMNITGSVWSEIALCPLESQSCYGWLENSHKSVSTLENVQEMTPELSCWYRYEDDHFDEIDSYDARYWVDIELSPNQNQLAVATTTEIKIYDAETLRLQNEIILPNEALEVRIDWGRQSQIAVATLYWDNYTASPVGGLFIIDAVNGDIHNIYTNGLVDVAWSPDESLVAILTGYGEVLVFGSANWEVVWQLDVLEHYGVVADSLAWSYDATFLAVVSDEGEDNAMLIWNTIEDRIYPLAPSTRINGGLPVWSPNVNVLAVLDRFSGWVEVWDVMSGAVIAHVDNDGGNPYSFAWFYNGSYLGIGTNQSITVWSVTTADPRIIIDYSENLPPFVQLLWSQTLERVYSVDYQGNVYLWNILASDCPERVLSSNRGN